MGLEQYQNLQPVNAGVAEAKRPPTVSYLEGSEPAGLVSTEGFLNSEMKPEEIKTAPELDNYLGAAGYAVGAAFRGVKNVKGHILNYVGQSILHGVEEDEKMVKNLGGTSPLFQKNLDHRRDLAMRLNTTALALRRQALSIESSEQEGSVGKNVSTGEQAAMGATSAALSTAPFLAVAGASLLTGPAAPVVTTVGSAIVALEMAMQTGLEQFQKGTDKGLEFDVNQTQAAEVAAFQGITDMAAGRFLAGLYGAAANKVIARLTKTAAGQRINFGKVATRALGQNAVVEGVTEAGQNLNNDAIDALTGIDENPSLRKSFKGALIAAIAGGLTGGVVGTGGVLLQRRKIVDMMKRQGHSTPVAERVADTVIWHGLDETQKSISERYGLGGDVKALNKKLQETNEKVAKTPDLDSMMAKVEAVAQPTAEQFIKAQEILSGMETTIAEAKIDEVEKTLSKATDEVDTVDEQLAVETEKLAQIRKDPNADVEADAKQENLVNSLQDQRTEKLRQVQNLTSEAEAYRLGLEKKTGAIRVDSALLRQKAKAIIRNYQKGFAKGSKISLKEANAVMAVAKQMVAAMPIPVEKKVKLLRRLRAQSAEAFQVGKAVKDQNGEVDTITFKDIIDEVYRESMVQEYKGIVKQAVTETLQSKDAPVKAQELARKIEGALEGTRIGLSSDPLVALAELNIDTLNGNPPVEEARQIAEWFASLAGEQYQHVLDATKERDAEYQSQQKSILQSIPDLSGAGGSDTEKGIVFRIVKGEIQEPDAGVRATGTTKETAIKTKEVWGLPPSVFTAFNAIAEILDRGDLRSKIGTGVAGRIASQLDTVVRNWKYGVMNAMREQSVAFASYFGKSEPFAQILMFEGAPSNVMVEFKNGAKKKLTKAEAIGLYLAAENTKTRKELIALNGISETWLEQFMGVPGFDAKDSQLLDFYRGKFKDYDTRIKPVFEEMTGVAWLPIEEYFPKHRYQREKTQEQIEDATAFALLAPDGEIDLSKISSLRNRVGGNNPIEIESVVRTYSRYTSDMEHFLAAAQWVRDARKILLNPSVRDAIDLKLDPRFSKLIETTVDLVARGRPDRSMGDVERSLNRVLVNWGMANLFGPEHALRQLTSLPVFLRYANPVELLGSMFDIAGRIATGRKKDLAPLWDGKEMQLRRMGVQDYIFTQFSEFLNASELAEWAGKAAQGDPVARARIALSGAHRGRAVQGLIKGWVIGGDQMVAMIGGWAVYQKALKAGKTPAEALVIAEDAIQTQQSVSPGRRPEIMMVPGVPGTLLNLFQQYQSQYMSEFLRITREIGSTVAREKTGAASAFMPKSGRSRVDYKDIGAALAVYFGAVPLANAFLISLLQGDAGETGERWKRYAPFGPFIEFAWTAEFLQALYHASVSDELAGMVDQPYQRDMARSNILDSAERRVVKVAKAIREATESGEYENVVADGIFPILSLAIEARTGFAAEEFGKRAVATGKAVWAVGSDMQEAADQAWYAVSGKKPKE